ncbi:hypothetical protein PI126_g8754 [Phytophthora idaei]|nr:hypothetical protein PI126_g8754 [Phytophthora idaei]
MERVHLRQQVRDMTAELEKMQKTKEANKSSKWMAFAKYQKEERLNAEEKQRRLCAAIDTRAATIQDFFKLTQTCLGELRGVSEEEARLIERTVDATPSGPFKRIRVDPPLDDVVERYVNEFDASDRSTSGAKVSCQLVEQRVIQVCENFHQPSRQYY